jgi:predicted GIY-YIG superfamily endonuclease
MKQYYVYELINYYGSVEYVGETTTPKGRMYDHIKRKPDSNNGKFYGRQDLIMNIVAVFDNRKEALKLEGKLKLDYNMEHTEMTRSSKAGKIASKKSVKNGHMHRIRIIAAEKNKKPVLQYSISGDFISEWDSAAIAEKELEKMYATSITQCCKGKLKTTGGYIWKYKQQ